MRELYLLILLLFATGKMFAQEKLSKEEQDRRKKNIEAGNPFKQFGSKAKVATLSNGKYLEVHDLDTIVTIGSVRFHVMLKKIVGKAIPDTINGMYARPIGDMPSRWISVDPLSEEFPEWSPYNMCFDNPMKFVDPDGRAAFDWFKNGAGRVVWVDSTSKGFTDTNGEIWSNVGANLNQVKQSLNVPIDVQNSNWGTMTGSAARGKDGAGKNWSAINVRHFKNSASVTYDLNVKNTGASGELISGKSEISGVSINARVSSQTSAPGTILTGVTGMFGVKQWTPSGLSLTSKSSLFQVHKGAMLSNFAFHATSNAVMNLSLSTYSKLANPNPPSTGLNLSFNVSTVTKDQQTSKKLIFNTNN